MHLILQKMDFKQDYDCEKIKKLIDDLVALNIISKAESEAIDINKIVDFTKTQFAQSLSKAKAIYKEQPFYINISAKELSEIDADEKILVQGIIDLYYMDENDNLILVDYKTDYVKEGKELVKKYQNQLDIYKKALELALNKNVYKTYIYSLYLNKEIEI